MLNAVITDRKNQLIGKSNALPRNPKTEFAPIMHSVVATAVLKDKCVNNKSAGRIKNPPPIPVKPARIPVKKPASVSVTSEVFLLVGLTLRPLMSSTAEINTNPAKRPNNAVLLGMTRKLV